MVDYNRERRITHLGEMGDPSFAVIVYHLDLGTKLTQLNIE